eukprot:3615183-Pleurochrysis_carterae.AAC.4
MHFEGRVTAIVASAPPLPRPLAGDGQARMRIRSQLHQRQRRSCDEYFRTDVEYDGCTQVHVFLWNTLGTVQRELPQKPWHT